MALLNGGLNLSVRLFMLSITARLPLLSNAT
jgi:hypothetical protein